MADLPDLPDLLGVEPAEALTCQALLDLLDAQDVAVLVEQLTREGYTVRRAASPWCLGPAESAL